MSLKEAMFWQSLDDAKVQCNLCHHRCMIRPGRCGICGVRENRAGILYSLVYGKATATAVDPIEKKPLYHFMPGTRTFSMATRGCNFKCLHCQNCDISQVSERESFDRDTLVTPEQIVRSARALGCRSISYTYTEPTIFFEYAYDTARVAAGQGLKNVFVTNGYITPEALRQAAPFIDAANIDLKFFSNEAYKKLCSARLQPVLDIIAMYHELGVWIEITTLIILSHNDAEDQLQAIAKFIAGLSVDIPWHISAFHPANKLTDVPSTPIPTMKNARRIGTAAGLKYVYMGNVDEKSDTRCPECRASLVERNGFYILSNRMKRGRCPECGVAVAGIWN